MVHRHESDESVLAPAYAARLSREPVPKNRLPESISDPATVYRFIHDELLLDGSSRLNLATFVTTWMDPEAERLMAETFDKNMIDKDEYPQTAEIERRCVNIVCRPVPRTVGRRCDRRFHDWVVGGGDVGRPRDEVAVAPAPAG